jgi:hypothetical protein
MTPAMRNVTTAAMMTERYTVSRFGTPGPMAAAVTAMMLPGAAGNASPPPRSMFVVTPAAPPAFSARIVVGLLRAYGK